MNQEIRNTLEALKNKGTILYPTDTIWGIGCDATSGEAVKKVYKIKKREDTKSLIILVSNTNMLYDYVDEIPTVAMELVEASVKPLTIIYPNAINLAKNVINEDGSIGIRVCYDKFCQALIQKFGKPIVSTSANISGEPSPRFFKEISKEILSTTDYVVNWRQDDNTPAEPSSIIKIGLNGTFQILRP